VRRFSATDRPARPALSIVDRMDQKRGHADGQRRNFPRYFHQLPSAVTRAFTCPYRHDLKIFSTCPLSARGAPRTPARANCRNRALERARDTKAFWSSPTTASWTRGWCRKSSSSLPITWPLVAIQPAYMHPYSVAK